MIKFKKDEYHIRTIILFIALIILVFPVLLTQPAFLPIFDFSDKGGIGDTFSGITAPFLNGLTAILVFLAFIEQVKANKHFMNLEERKSIVEQINYLLNYNIVNDVNRLEELYKTINTERNIDFEYICGRLKVILYDIKNLESQINKFKGDKDILKIKFLNIIRELYVSPFYTLPTNYNAKGKINEDYVELLDEITELRKHVFDFIKL